jgi:hypothetical protein
MARLTKLEVNARRDAGLSVEVFQHVQFGIFNVSAMRSMIGMHPDKFKVHEVDFENLKADGQDIQSPQQFLDWLVGQREIDEERIAALTPEELEDPVIHVIDLENSQFYLIDGIHRLVGRFRRGDKTLKTYVYPLQYAPMVEPGLYVDRPWGTKDVDLEKGVLRDTITGEER